MLAAAQEELVHIGPQDWVGLHGVRPAEPLQRRLCDRRVHDDVRADVVGHEGRNCELDELLLARARLRLHRARWGSERRDQCEGGGEGAHARNLPWSHQRFLMRTRRVTSPSMP